MQLSSCGGRNARFAKRLRVCDELDLEHRVLSKMETQTINPDCEIEQLLFHMKINGIRPNSTPGRILLWLEKSGPGDYSVVDIAKAVSLTVRGTRLAIVLVCCTVNATKMRSKYNILISGKTKTAVAHFARL
jgi:hypothetical protein